MNTKGKIVIIILIVGFICIGGMKMKLHIAENEMKKEILKREGPRVEKFMKYNFEGIKKITIKSLEETPMGGYFLNGYINDDKDLDFSADIGTKFEKNISYSEELIPKKKDSNGVEILKDIEDIEEEEKHKE